MRTAAAVCSVLARSSVRGSRLRVVGSKTAPKSAVCGARCLSVCGASKNSDGLPKYEGHYPLDTPQRMFLGPVSAVSALLQPTRGDMVATLGEVTGTAALRYMLKQMQSDPIGRQILEERPIVNEATVDPHTLIKLPEETMGHQYAKYMLAHSFSSDERTAVRYVDDEQLAYVMLRYRQVHDFWHVLSGLPPTVMGEIALKWLELGQTRLPMTMLSSVFGQLRLRADERQLMRTVYIPWAMRNARNARPLLCYRYEDNLTKTVDEVRKYLRIEAAPKLPDHTIAEQE